jgi:hypothetical protein
MAKTTLGDLLAVELAGRPAYTSSHLFERLQQDVECQIAGRLLLGASHLTAEPDHQLRAKLSLYLPVTIATNKRI